jgi:hypothetical protein
MMCSRPTPGSRAPALTGSGEAQRRIGLGVVAEPGRIVLDIQGTWTSLSQMHGCCQTER